LTLILAFSVAQPTDALATTPLPSPLKPVIKTLTFIPATHPLMYRLGSSDIKSSIHAFILPQDTNSIADERRERSDKFNDAMKAHNFRSDNELSAAVISELEKLGYGISTPNKINRKIRNPDDIDYANFEFITDALLHVSFGSIGAYMPRDNSGYYPRLNVAGIVFSKGAKRALYDNVVYFGIDADEKDKELFTGKDSQYLYKNFEELMANISPLIEAYHSAIPIIARRMAMHIHEKLK
jgi:hypothetical protein